MMQTNQDLLSTTQVAQLLNVSTRTVQRWITSGQLRAIRVGKLFRIRQEDLDAFIEDPGKKE